MWLILQSDKGLSSVRLAEALGIIQPTAWRLGHALRLMMAPVDRLGGTVEIDGFYVGGEPKKGADGPDPGRGRKGLRKTLKTPVLAIVQRPADDLPGSPAGAARAAVVKNLSVSETARVLEKDVQRTAHLISDEWKSFVALGHNFVAHETVRHSKQEYVRGDVHANSAEGFNSRGGEPSLAYFTISARNMPICTSMRSASAGPSASLVRKSSDEPATVG